MSYDYVHNGEDQKKKGMARNKPVSSSELEERSDSTML